MPSTSTMPLAQPAARDASRRARQASLSDAVSTAFAGSEARVVFVVEVLKASPSSGPTKPPRPEPPGNKRRLLALTAVRSSSKRGFKGSLHVLKWPSSPSAPPPPSSSHGSSPLPPPGSSALPPPILRKSYPLKAVTRFDALRGREDGSVEAVEVSLAPAVGFSGDSRLAFASSSGPRSDFYSSPSSPSLEDLLGVLSAFCALHPRRGGSKKQQQQSSGGGFYPAFAGATEDELLRWSGSAAETLGAFGAGLLTQQRGGDGIGAGARTTPQLLPPREGATRGHLVALSSSPASSASAPTKRVSAVSGGNAAAIAEDLSALVSLALRRDGDEGEGKSSLTSSSDSKKKKKSRSGVSTAVRRLADEASSLEAANSRWALESATRVSLLAASASAAASRGAAAHSDALAAATSSPLARVKADAGAISARNDALDAAARNGDALVSCLDACVARGRVPREVLSVLAALSSSPSPPAAAAWDDGDGKCLIQPPSASAMTSAALSLSRALAELEPPRLSPACLSWTRATREARENLEGAKDKLVSGAVEWTLRASKGSGPSLRSLRPPGGLAPLFSALLRLDRGCGPALAGALAEGARDRVFGPSSSSAARPSSSRLGEAVSAAAARASAAALRAPATAPDFSSGVGGAIEAAVASAVAASSPASSSAPVSTSASNEAAALEIRSAFRDALSAWVPAVSAELSAAAEAFAVVGDESGDDSDDEKNKNGKRETSVSKRKAKGENWLERDRGTLAALSAALLGSGAAGRERGGGGEGGEVIVFAVPAPLLSIVDAVSSPNPNRWAATATAATAAASSSSKHHLLLPLAAQAAGAAAEVGGADDNGNSSQRQRRRRRKREDKTPSGPLLPAHLLPLRGALAATAAEALARFERYAASCEAAALAAAGLNEGGDSAEDDDASLFPQATVASVASATVAPASSSSSSTTTAVFSGSDGNSRGNKSAKGTFLLPCVRAAAALASSLVDVGAFDDESALSPPSGPSPSAEALLIVDDGEEREGGNGASETDGGSGSDGASSSSSPSTPLSPPPSLPPPQIPSVADAASQALLRVTRAAWRASKSAALGDGGHHGARLLAQSSLALCGALRRVAVSNAVAPAAAASSSSAAAVSALRDRCAAEGHRARLFYARSLLSKEKLLGVVELSERLRASSRAEASSSSSSSPPVRLTPGLTPADARAALAPAGVFGGGGEAAGKRRSSASQEGDDDDGRVPLQPPQLPSALAKKLSSLAARALRHAGGGGGGDDVEAAAEAAVEAAEEMLESAAAVAAEVFSPSSSDVASAAAALASVLAARRRWKESEKEKKGSRQQQTQQRKRFGPFL